MFLVNSRLGLVIATSSSYNRKDCYSNEAPLLPKLRGYFAEFLNQSFLDHLSILYSPTCGGLGYGHQITRKEAFLVGVGSVTSPK